MLSHIFFSTKTSCINVRKNSYRICLKDIFLARPNMFLLKITKGLSKHLFRLRENNIKRLNP